MTVTDQVHEHVLKNPASAWTPAVEIDGEARDEARVAELSGRPLHGRPKGMRLIVRKERPHSDGRTCAPCRRRPCTR